MEMVILQYNMVEHMYQQNPIHLTSLKMFALRTWVLLKMINDLLTGYLLSSKN